VTKITNVTQTAKERLERTFNNFNELKFTEFDVDGETLYTLNLCLAMCKLYPHDSSIAIYLGGKVDILECDEYGELRFC
jgi:hypothetical protein